MCLIMQADRDIPVDFFKHVAQRNKDGFGMMWIQDNQIRTYKTLDKDMDAFKAKFDEVKQYQPYIHFRMRTHGEIDDHNCHPYYCGSGIYLMHNGVLGVKQWDKEKSDTWHFVYDVLRPLFKASKNPHELIRSPVFNNIMEQYCGKGSRLVFGDRGGYALINADDWVQVKEERTGCKGLMVSNSYAWSESSFRAPTTVTSFESFGGKYYSSHTTYPYGLSGKLTKREKRYVKSMLKEFETKRELPPHCSYIGLGWEDCLEELKHPYYVDKDFKVWEKLANGFCSRPLVEWTDLVDMGKPFKGKNGAIIEYTPKCQQEEKKDEKTEAPPDAEFELAPSSTALVAAADANEEKEAEAIAEQQSEEEQELVKEMVTHLKNASYEDLQAACLEEPLDTAAVLFYILHKGVDNEPMVSPLPH